MQIYVGFPSGGFGGHDITDFTATINYSGYPDSDYDGEHEDLSLDGYIGSRIFALLKGQKCDSEIEDIAEKGEILSRLHIQTILNRWMYGSFDRSQLPQHAALEKLEAERLSRIEQRAKKRLASALKRKRRDLSLEIRFKSNGTGTQSGGTLTLRVGTAEELAHMILAACKLSADNHGTSQRFVEK